MHAHKPRFFTLDQILFTNNKFLTCTERLARISQTKPQWLLQAKIKSYKLYDYSFLSLIYSTGWVSDEVRMHR